MTLNKFFIISVIYLQAIMHGFSPKIIAAQVFVESSFNPAAVNGRSVGLMQVNLSVWKKELNIDESRMTEPFYNLNMGLKILRIYLNKTGNIWDALFMYNNGYKHKNYKYVPKIKRTMIKLYGGTLWD